MGHKQWLFLFTTTTAEAVVPLVFLLGTGSCMVLMLLKMKTAWMFRRNLRDSIYFSKTELQNTQKKRSRDYKKQQNKYTVAIIVILCLQVLGIGLLIV